MRIIDLIKEAIKIHEKELPQKKGFWLKRTIDDCMKSYKYSSLGEIDKVMWEKKASFSKRRIVYIRENPKEFSDDCRKLYK